VEAALVGEELHVDDVEAVKFTEEPGGGVGDRAHGVSGVGGHPLLEFEVGVEKLEVVHVVVALVDEVATEGRGSGRQNRLQHWKQKQKEDQNCFTAARVGC